MQQAKRFPHTHTSCFSVHKRLSSAATRRQRLCTEIQQMFYLTLRSPEEQILEQRQTLHTVTSPAPQAQERNRGIRATALELFACCICLSRVSFGILYLFLSK